VAKKCHQKKQHLELENYNRNFEKEEELKKNKQHLNKKKIELNQEKL
jgi:hypothetical protein